MPSDTTIHKRYSDLSQVGQIFYRNTCRQDGHSFKKPCTHRECKRFGRHVHTSMGSMIQISKKAKQECEWCGLEK